MTKRLTPKKHERILNLVAIGYTQEQIADKLRICDRTVRNHIKKEREATISSPIKDSLSSVVEHDRKVFTESDAILNEQEVREFLSHLEDNQRFHVAEILKFQEYFHFFEFECNKYIDANLRSLYMEVVKTFCELQDFILATFKDSEVDDTYKFAPAGDPWKIETDEEYHTKQRQLYDEIEKFLKTYIAYRGYVRDNLHF